MPEQGGRGGQQHLQKLRATANSKAIDVVESMVAEFGGLTVHGVRPRAFAAPSPDSTEPEPLACLEAARELEKAAHSVQLSYIRKAREADRSWMQIGDALDLHWAAVANKESMADEAYDYALRYGPYPNPDKFTWTCPTCHQVITDHGPFRDLPYQEEGHADSCTRWAAELAAWKEYNDRREQGSGQR